MLLLGVPVGLLLFSPIAGATTYTWNNAAGGAWSNAANWTPNGVPDVAGESAVLPALSGAYQVTLDLNPDVDQLDLASGSTLDINGRSIGAIAAVNNGGNLAHARGTFDGNGFHNLSGGTVDVATNDSVVVVNGQLLNDGIINVSGSGAVLHFVGINQGPYVGTHILGTGTIHMDGGRISTPLAWPFGGIKTHLDNGAGHTIDGWGYIHSWVDNHGTLHANVATKTLRLWHMLYNYEETRASNGGTFDVGMPLLENWGGRLVGSDGTIKCLGTIDNMDAGGDIIADGGDLHIDCGSVLEGQYKQTGGSGEIGMKVVNLQNPVVTAGAVLVAETLIDLTASGSKLYNNGTVIIRGRLNVGGWENDSISFVGPGTMILEGGTLGTPVGAKMVNEAGHTITGCGTIDARLINRGSITVDCGDGLIIRNAESNRSMVNYGTIRTPNGFMKITGSGTPLINRGTISTAGGQIWVDQGATLDNTGGTFRADGGLVYLGIYSSCTVKGGVLDASNGGIFSNWKQTTLENVTLGTGAQLITQHMATTYAAGTRLVNQGTQRIVGSGRVAIGPTTRFVQTSGATILENGGSMSSFRELELSGGALRGNGTVVGSLANAGELSPNSTGLIRIQGNYRQLPTGRLAIGLGGLDPSQMSRLEVTGQATLDGNLAVAALGSFDPSGHLFDVLSYGSVAGSFKDCSGTGMELMPLYGDKQLSVAVNTGPLAVDPRNLPQTLRFAGSREKGAFGFALDLPRAAEVTLRAYDVTGREVATLANGPREAGTYFFALSGARAAVPGLSSGVYFARMVLRANGATETRTARVVMMQ